MIEHNGDTTLVLRSTPISCNSVIIWIAQGVTDSEEAFSTADAASMNAGGGETGESEAHKGDGMAGSGLANTGVEIDNGAGIENAAGDDGGGTENYVKGDVGDGHASEKIESEGKVGSAEETGNDQVAGSGNSEQDKPAAEETAAAIEPGADAPPLVVTEIALLTFGEGETVRSFAPLPQLMMALTAVIAGSAAAWRG